MSKVLHSKSGKNLLMKIGLLVFAVCMVCIHSESVKAETAGEYTIYGWDTIVPDEYIPAGYPKSCQLPKIDGQKTSYQIMTGLGRVSEDGIVTSDYSAKTAINPLTGSFVSYGKAVDSEVRVQAYSGNTRMEYIVHIKNGKQEYYEDVMDEYIKKNITDGMGDKALLNMIARFPAQYDYSVNCQYAEDMVLFGGGDCWASTDAIIKISERMGIKAWKRDADKDPGAASGHKNAMVELNGEYYELDSGYSNSTKNSNGLRHYSVSHRSSLFSYRLLFSEDAYYTDEIAIYQYDGYDTIGILDIPESIDGYKVTVISGGTFADKGYDINEIRPSWTQFTRINLPDTIERIGDKAFESCHNLESITLPASVKSIGKNVFSRTGLTSIKVADDNATYKAIDNAIYSKDGKVLICCPTAKTITIPDTVTKIGDYAFSDNDNLTVVNLPNNVEELGKGAFKSCDDMICITFSGNKLKTIGNECFYGSSALPKITIPASVKSLGSRAFSYCSSLRYVDFCGDAPSFGAIDNGSCTDDAFANTRLTARYLKGNSTWSGDALTGHGGTVIWEEKDNFTAVSIKNAVVTFDEEEFAYANKPIKPQETVILDGQTLERDKDYSIKYYDNWNIGMATANIIGIGNYEGVLVKEYSIVKAQRDLRPSLLFSTIKVGKTSKVGFYNSNYGAQFASEDETIATVDSEGVITGVGAGETRIMVHVPETENYVAFDKAFDIKVTKSIENATITPEKEKYPYKAGYIVPKVTVVLDEVTLKENEDYKVTVTNNKNVGMADIKITGLNLYYGECLAQFEIEKSERTVEAKLSKSSISIGEVSKIEFEPVLSSEDGKYITYESENPEIATVDAYGKVKGVNQGTANIVIHMLETANRLASDLNVTIEVIQSSNNNNSGSNNKYSDNKHDKDKFPVDISQECNHEYVMEYKVEPTCLWDGSVGYSCIECGDIYEENMKALGHDFTSDGIYCSRCGVVNPDNYNVNNTPDVNKKTKNKEVANTPNTEKSYVTKCKAEKKGLRIYFKTNSKVDGYQIQCASNKKFTKKLKTAEVKNNKTKSVKIKNLKKKTAYYVRIRTYKLVSANGKVQKIYSEWSNCKKVKTK